MQRETANAGNDGQPEFLTPSEFLEKARRLGVRTEADGVAMIREDRDRDCPGDTGSD